MSVAITKKLAQIQQTLSVPKNSTTLLESISTVPVRIFWRV